MEPNENIFLGIDIGSSKICISVCELTAVGELQILGVGTSIANGISKGKITDSNQLFKSIERAVKRAEREANKTSNNIIVNIPYHSMEFIHNKGIILSKEETGQISYNDKLECLRRSKNIPVSDNKTLIHTIPIKYHVDGKDVKNPVGVFGKSLESETLLIASHAENIIILKNILKNMGFFIKGFVYDGLAQGQIMLVDSELKNGAIMIDMGGQSTKIAVFEKGKLIDSTIFPFGADILTKDIAKCLNVSEPEAERLKILYGDINMDRVNQSETVEINSKTEGRKTIKRVLLCQILKSRKKEMINFMIEKIPKLSEDSYNIVLGGGGSLLKGLCESMKSSLNNNIRQGVPESIQNIIESTTYATSSGLVLYALKTNAIEYVPQQYSVLNKCISWVKKYL